MQRFFVKFEGRAGTLENIGKEIIISDQALIHQMKQVLRMKAGDQFVVLDGSGFEYFCTLSVLKEKQIKAKVIEKQKNAAEPSEHLVLYQALPKKIELFEWVLQKGTEVGVSCFVPLVTSRGERTNFPKRERLEKILKEAAEQSGRGKIPTLSEPVDFSLVDEQILKQAVVLHPSQNHPPLSDTLSIIKKWEIVNLFVGPEGGFSEGEIERAQKAGALICSLGPRVLRAETVGIVAAGIILLC